MLTKILNQLISVLNQNESSSTNAAPYASVSTWKYLGSTRGKRGRGGSKSDRGRGLSSSVSPPKRPSSSKHNEVKLLKEKL